MVEILAPLEPADANRAHRQDHSARADRQTRRPQRPCEVQDVGGQTPVIRDRDIMEVASHPVVDAMATAATLSIASVRAWATDLSQRLAAVPWSEFGRAGRGVCAAVPASLRAFAHGADVSSARIV